MSSKFLKKFQFEPLWLVPRVLLTMYSVGACSRAYGDYNQYLKGGGADWYAVLNGTADAPEQYRIGVVRAAAFINDLHITGHAGLRLSRSFAIFDLVGSLVALLLLLALVERSAAYRRAPQAARWFAMALFMALAFYALDWTTWYRRVGTLPVCGMTALWIWLWTPLQEASESRGVRLFARAFALLAVCAVLSTIRADLALFLAGGVFVAVLLGWTGPLALPRSLALAVSSACALLAAAIQGYIMRVLYPHATYGITPIFMLRHDYYRPTEWAAFFIFTAPALWTLRHFLRRGFAKPNSAAGLLLTVPAYLLLWITVGRVDEVRIFLPLALALLPTTVEVALQRFAEVPTKDRGVFAR